MQTLYGDKVTISSDVGSVSFNDTDLSGWSGAIKVRLDDMPGWDETFDLDVISTPRGFGDGNYTAARFPAKARMLTVAGYAIVPGRAALDLIWDRIVSLAFPADTDLKLTRFEPVPKYVVARLAGPVSRTQYLPVEGALRFEAILLCSDPYKYDALNVLTGTSGIAGISQGGRVYPRTYPLQYIQPASGSGNQVVIVNSGTAKAAPVFTIRGPLASGWRLENSTTGDEQAFDITLSTGDTLVIDNGAKTAYLNGSLINGLLLGDWLTLKQGVANVIKLFGDYNASASFTVTAVPRWR